MKPRRRPVGSPWAGATSRRPPTRCAARENRSPGQGEPADPGSEIVRPLLGGLKPRPLHHTWVRWPAFEFRVTAPRFPDPGGSSRVDEDAEGVAVGVRCRLRSACPGRRIGRAGGALRGRGRVRAARPARSGGGHGQVQVQLLGYVLVPGHVEAGSSSTCWKASMGPPAPVGASAKLRPFRLSSPAGGIFVAGLVLVAQELAVELGQRTGVGGVEDHRTPPGVVIAAHASFKPNGARPSTAPTPAQPDNERPARPSR